jgi:hypothetical protein
MPYERLEKDDGVDINDNLYPDTPSSQDVYYAPGRGSETFESAHLFDFALTYSAPRSRPTPNSPRDALGIPTGFIRGPQFGRGTATTHYPFPRGFLMSVGIRF